MAEANKNNKRKLKIALLKTIGIVALAFVLSFILAQPFSISTATLISANDRSDFVITDFYNVVANSRHVRTLDPDIVIVNIDNSDRDQIADIIDMLNLCEPSVIGVDATFDVPRDGDLDEHLLATVEHTPNIVLATTVQQDSAAATFHYADHSFFQDDMPQTTWAAVTLPSKFAKSTIRNFPVKFTMTDSTTTLGFAAALAQKHDSLAFNKLIARGNKNEIINYPSREYRIFLPDQIADNAEDFYGKVVLVGALNERSDEHATPVQPVMSGVEIHAHSLSTILSGEYMSKLSDSQNWLIAIALCSMFAFLCVTIDVGVKGIILRILQVLMLYLIVRCGYYFFINHNILIDFSYSFLMITFGLFAADIWIGCTTIGKRTIKRIKSSKLMKSSTFARRATMLVIASCAVVAMSAKYTLHSYSGNVVVERNKTVIPTQVGMELRANDVVTIPEGAQLEILNSFNSKIFKSVKSGKYGVSKIMIEAQMQANDSGANVNSRLRMSKGAQGAQEVYVDNGKVTRALEIYDPSAENLQIDCNLLGRKVMSMLMSKPDTAATPLPIESLVAEDGGNGFRLVNTLDFPVYFNVVKMGNKGVESVEISELGQPMGSYVVKPEQSITRQQISPLNATETHVLILTHYYFDIDKLIESMQALPSGTIGDTPSDEELPIYIKTL